MIQWGSFRELLENEKSRRLIGFDMFDAFPDSGTIDSDKQFIEKWNSDFAGEFLTRDELYQSLKLKGINNVELIKGNILKTLPEFLSRNGQLRIALLHIDTDVYEPCKVGLELLFDRIVPNGLIVFDDYSTIEGETLAVDEFFADRKHEFMKFPFSHSKPIYMIKH